MQNSLFQPATVLQVKLEESLRLKLSGMRSTLFTHRTGQVTTPGGRMVMRISARAHPTSVKGCTSLPTLSHVLTPRASEPDETQEAFSRRMGDRTLECSGSLSGMARPASVPTPTAQAAKHGDLSQAEADGIESGKAGIHTIAQLASCPTPMAGSPATETYNAAGNNNYSRRIVDLATVATPRSEDSQCAGPHRGTPDSAAQPGEPERSSNSDGSGQTANPRDNGKSSSLSQEERRTEHGSALPGGCDGAGSSDNPIGAGLEGHFGHVREWRGPGWLNAITARSVAEAGATRGFWADCDWWYGRDGKYRPIGPGVQPLAHGVAARVVKLRGYGDAIVAPVAQAFIEAYLAI